MNQPARRRSPGLKPGLARYAFVKLLPLAVTGIVITHRLTTAMHADVIHVMEHGRIVESGTQRSVARIEGTLRRVVGSTET